MAIREIRSISFAGAGNVASYLAPVLLKAGYRIASVYSRNVEHAALLADRVGAVVAAEPALVANDCDLLIVALPDQAIPGFVSGLRKNAEFSGIVAHTSGSQSLTSIQQYYSDAGVLYPLQSFTKFTHPDVSKVPICIEGTSPEIVERLAEVAQKLSGDVRVIDTAQRAKIHLAAVFANNFVNYMYSVSDCLLAKSGVSPDVLLPLIRETALRLNGGDAAKLQTGPAMRNDWSTIDMHLNMLRTQPGLKEIYKVITDHIVKSQSGGGTC